MAALQKIGTRDNKYKTITREKSKEHVKINIQN